MLRMISLLFVAVIAGSLGVGAAQAQVSAPTAQAAGAQIDAAGKVITRKKLALCRKQARDQKLTYFKRREFIRKCVAE
jgi:hypothetical protein